MPVVAFDDSSGEFRAHVEIGRRPTAVHGLDHSLVQLNFVRMQFGFKL